MSEVVYEVYLTNRKDTLFIKPINPMDTAGAVMSTEFLSLNIGHSKNFLDTKLYNYINSSFFTDRTRLSACHGLLRRATLNTEDDVIKFRSNAYSPYRYCKLDRCIGAITSNTSVGSLLDMLPDKSKTLKEKPIPVREVGELPVVQFDLEEITRLSCRSNFLSCL